MICSPRPGRAVRPHPAVRWAAVDGVRNASASLREVARGIRESLPGVTPSPTAPSLSDCRATRTPLCRGKRRWGTKMGWMWEPCASADCPSLPGRNVQIQGLQGEAGSLPQAAGGPALRTGVVLTHHPSLGLAVTFLWEDTILNMAGEEAPGRKWKETPVSSPFHSEGTRHSHLLASRMFSAQISFLQKAT